VADRVCCNALGDLKGTLANSPAATFNLANCAETNGRTSEAVRLLDKYLEMAPKALDAEETRARIADLKSLVSLPGQNGVEVRRLYASGYGALAQRKYDRVLADFTKAGDLAPEFALTKWKLGLLYEAMGNVGRARENFRRFQQLGSDQTAKDDAALHLSTLDAKHTKYGRRGRRGRGHSGRAVEPVDEIDLQRFRKRSALRTARARAKKKEQAKAKGRVAGFALPYPFAQQQLARASEHLQIALALFPLGAAANELMGLVYCRRTTAVPR